MLGPFTVGKKAAKWGYKKYGLPGAVVTGAAGVAGYVAVRRALRRAIRGDGSNDQSSGDPSTDEGSGPSG